MDPTPQTAEPFAGHHAVRGPALLTSPIRPSTLAPSVMRNSETSTSRPYAPLSKPAGTPNAASDDAPHAWQAESCGWRQCATGVTVWLHRMWCSQCVSNRLFVLSFLCMGRCGGSHDKVRKKPPSPKRWLPAVAAPYLLRTGRTCRSGPELFGPIPFAFRGSRGCGVSPTF